MKKILFHVLVLLLFSCGKDEEIAKKSIADQIVDLVNEHRSNLSLVKLEISQESTTQALLHSENMSNGITPYGHDGFDTRFELLVDQINAHSMGENVATGQTSAQQVMDDWINSEGHRANIEGDYTHIGVGVAQNKEGEYYFTQIFVKL